MKANKINFLDNESATIDIVTFEDKMDIRVKLKTESLIKKKLISFSLFDIVQIHGRGDDCIVVFLNLDNSEKVFSTELFVGVGNPECVIDKILEIRDNLIFN